MGTLHDNGPVAALHKDAGVTIVSRNDEERTAQVREGLTDELVTYDAIDLTVGYFLHGGAAVICIEHAKEEDERVDWHDMITLGETDDPFGFGMACVECGRVVLENVDEVQR